MDRDLAKELLQTQFEGTAEWRRRKAAEYPDDRRNLEAAEILDKLASSVERIHDDFLTAYVELHDDDDDCLRIVEAESEKCRAIGFHEWPSSAEEFLKDIITEMTIGRGVYA